MLKSLDHDTELHHSQTQRQGQSENRKFDHYTELHHSQTLWRYTHEQLMFDHHTELHHSQTSKYEIFGNTITVLMFLYGVK